MDKKKNKFLSFLKMPMRWLRRLYNWTLQWARTKKASDALFGIAFMESSFFPIPPDVLSIAMVIAERKKWWRFSLICTLSSVIGALFGYLIGWGFYEIIGRAIVEIYKLENVVELMGKKI